VQSLPIFVATEKSVDQACGPSKFPGSPAQVATTMRVPEGETST